MRPSPPRTRPTDRTNDRFPKPFGAVLQVNVKKVSAARRWSAAGCAHAVVSLCVSRYDDSLQPIRLVTDHLTERLNLDIAFSASPSAASPAVVPPPFDHPRPTRTATKKRSRSTTTTTSSSQCVATKRPDQNDVTTMSNNNLMFRSMFFMNEEARHFLAPPIQLSTTDGEYFTRKASNPNLNTHHQQQQQQQQQAVAALTNSHDSSSNSVDIKPVRCYAVYAFNNGRANR